MAKAKKTAFFCQNCGYESAKWMGQCPACREWNTFVEEPTAAKTPAGTQGIGNHSAAGRKPVHLMEISTGKEERIQTGIGELDRVLGGGIVPGSLTLVGGDPGIGKSTLLLQVCRMLSTAGHQVLYISGEESLRQIKLRAVRIGEFNENLSLLCETNLDIIRAVMEKEKPEMAVIDSIQTMYNEEVSSAPGSVSQVRESTNVLMQIAKGMGISIFIVGHVTKDGNVAGPRVLEHMVDTVLYFEGDRQMTYRILRAEPDAASTPDIQYMLAILASRLGDEEQAVTYFLRSVELRESLKFRGNLDPEISRLIRKYGLFREDFE